MAPSIGLPWLALTCLSLRTRKCVDYLKWRYQGWSSACQAVVILWKIHRKLVLGSQWFPMHVHIGFSKFTLSALIGTILAWTT